MSLQGLSVRRRPRPITLLSVVATLLTGCANTDSQDLQQFVESTKAATVGEKLDPLPVIEPYRPFTYTAQGLKDPFVPATFVQQELLVDIPPEEAKSDNGIRPDPTRPREELEKYALGSLKMMGTLQKEGEIWVLIKAPDGIVHRVRTGNYLGLSHGKIIGITEKRTDLMEIVSDGDKRWTQREAFLSLAE